MIFYLLSLIFFALGVSNSLKSFYVLILVLPISNSLSGLFLKNGVFVYDLFFLGLAVLLMYKTVRSGKLKWNPILIVIVVLLIYAAFAVLEGIEINKYYLRDFRPLLFAIELYLLYSFSQKFSFRSILHLCLIGSLFNIFWFALIASGFISFEDQYYISNAYRYADVSSYFLAVVIIYIGSLSGKDMEGVSPIYYKVVYFLILVSILITGYRMLILATLLAIVFQNFSFKRVLKYSVLGTALVFGLFFYASQYGILRLTDSFSLEALTLQFATRYSPSIVYLNDLDLLRSLFGYGFGTVFEIPWFQYSETVDTTLNSIDSTYLTFFVKYGLFSLLIVLIFVTSYFKFLKTLKKIPISIFLFMLFFVYAIPYQLTALGISLGLHCIKNASENVRDKLTV